MSVKLIAGLLIMISLGGGVYYLGRSQTPGATPAASQATNTPAQSDETANWKTYKDSTYTFGYPPDWRVEGSHSDYYEGQQVIIKNPSGTVVINITPAQAPYGFGGEEEWKENQLEVFIEGKKYSVKEIIRSNKKAHVDIAVNKTGKEYHILFGTGYPAGSDNQSSINDYYTAREIILKVLSTLKIN